MEDKEQKMNTAVWKVTDCAPEELGARLQKAAALLQAGEVVAFPTETVYGLGGDARSEEAVERIFKAKGRPSDNPLIVHIADRSQLEELTGPLDPLAERLIERFWPGPLTLVLPVRPGAVSQRVTAGLATVAVRMPAHPVALALIQAAGCPVAAPSANRSGRPSPTAASHVHDDLAGRIAGLVDGGPAGVGLESTVVEASAGVVQVLRPGGVTLEQLRDCVPDAEVLLDPALRGDSHHDQAPKSPGMKYAHYAPCGELTLVEGPAPAVQAYIAEQLAAARSRGQRTGVLAFGSTAHYNADVHQAIGSHTEAAARSLYEALRAFDREEAAVIYAEGCPEAGMGLALMNRLRKAAGGRIIRLVE